MGCVPSVPRFSQGACHGGVQVLLGRGDGTFLRPSSNDSGGWQPHSVAIADINGDGRADLIVANWCLNTIDFPQGCKGVADVLLGNGDGTFQRPQPYFSGDHFACSISVGDVNGDGKRDLVIANVCAAAASYPPGSVGVLLGNGDGTFQTAQTYASGGWYATSTALLDANRDGRLDIVVANNCSSQSNPCEGTVGVLLNKTIQATRCSITADAVYVHKELQYRFVARVTSTVPLAIPTGNVSFWDSAYSEVVLGHAPLIDGKASLTVLLASEPNPQWVKAVYKGDGNFKGCESPYFAIFQ